MHVVVIEDDRSIAQLLQVILNTDGINRTTLILDDFEQLARNVDWLTVDAVICDRFLNGVDGVGILEWLTEAHPYVWRVMMTADDSIDATAAHAHVLLSKPASVEAIRRALREVRREHT